MNTMRDRATHMHLVDLSEQPIEIEPEDRTLHISTWRPLFLVIVVFWTLVVLCLKACT